MSITDSTVRLPSDGMRSLFFMLTGSPCDIEDWICLKRAIISSWLEELNALPSDNWVLWFPSPFFVLPASDPFWGGRPLLLSSDLMLTMVNFWGLFWEAKSEVQSAISAKLNKLHQRMISQSVISKISGPRTYHPLIPRLHRKSTMRLDVTDTNRRKVNKQHFSK